MDQSHRIAQAYRMMKDVRTGHETSNVQAVFGWFHQILFDGIWRRE